MPNLIRDNTHYVIVDDWRGKTKAHEWFYYSPATNAIRLARFVSDKIIINVYTFKRCNIPLPLATQIALWFKQAYMEGKGNNENEPLYFTYHGDDTDAELR